MFTMVGGRVGLSDWVGFFVPLVIYPFTFIVMNYFITEQKQIDFIIRMLLWGTVIVFVLAFAGCIRDRKILYSGTYRKLHRLYFSTNWYAEKYNGVQEGVTYSKTVSTYQNGNLLGVNILLFCPMIYESIENKTWRNIYMLVFILFCILTGSKTCWVEFLFIFL